MSEDLDRRKTASTWFEELRDQICAVFEQIETELEGTGLAQLPPGKFVRTAWARGEDQKGGGGEMSLLHGRVFEKVGVNISTVHGVFSEEFRKQIPGSTDSGEFWASGISLVAHMHSPHVPAVHFNTRYIVTSKSWFGGGTDLTPMFFDTPDTAKDKALFHEALQISCDQHNKGYYPKFSKWCDDYFFLKHRNEPRGVGGIFFDYLDDNWDANFRFVQDVGRTFLDVYPRIVRSRMQTDWSDQEREHQLIRRGRYVEFNLLYDRGTTFGLKTGGYTDAILMSLPPHAKWP